MILIQIRKGRNIVEVWRKNMIIIFVIEKRREKYKNKCKEFNKSY